MSKLASIFGISRYRKQFDMTSSSIWTSSDQTTLDSRELIDQGYLEEAEILMMSIYLRAPRHNQNLVNLVSLAEARRDWITAIFWTKRLVMRTEDVWQKKLQIVKFLALRGKPRKATRMLKNIANKDPENLDQIYLISTMLRFFQEPYRSQNYLFLKHLLDANILRNGETSLSLRILAKFAELDGKWGEVYLCLSRAAAIRPEAGWLRAEAEAAAVRLSSKSP